MAALGGELEILRVVVSSIEDDEILETSGDKELAVVDEAKVAGAKELSALRRCFDDGAEGVGAFLRVVPVTGGDALSAHPDLADTALIARHPRVRVHDANVLTLCRRAGRDETQAIARGR